jgi:hypothetical protein
MPKVWELLKDAVWKAIGRLVRLIDTIVRAMLPDKWVTAPNGEARTWVLVATWTVTTVLILGVAAGVASAILFVNDLMGGGGSPAPAAVLALTAASTPTVGPLPAAAPPVPGIITVRGTLDVSLYTKSGMNVVENSIILQLPRDGGPVKGTVMVGLDNFPIGAALEQIHEGLGGSPDDYPALQGCTSVVTLKADDIQGSYSPQGATITGSAAFVGKVEDTPCLSGLPPSMNANDAVEPTTLTLDATFDGREVQGTFTAPSGEQQKFEATAQ